MLSVRFQSDLVLLIMDLLKVLNGQNGIHRVEDHEVSLHGFHGGLPQNLCAVLTGIVVPIAVDIPNPVKDVLLEHLSGSGKGVSGGGAD